MSVRYGQGWHDNKAIKVLCFFFLILCFLAQVAAAFAQTHTTGRFGAWETFEGRSTQGNYICGMMTSEQGKSLLIKSYQNSEYFTIQVFSDDWIVPRATEVAVAFRFGNMFNSERLRGEAHPASPPVSAAVEVHILYENSSAFWNAFSWANTGYLYFLTGNEGSWKINLTGSNAATQQHLRCLESRGFARQLFSSQPRERPSSEIFPPIPSEQRQNNNGSNLFVTASLTQAEIRTLSEQIAECWHVDGGMMGLQHIVVEMRVRLDGQGNVRNVVPAGNMPGDPRVRAVFESARRALLSPQCNPLRLPPEKYETVMQSIFRFSPRGLVQ
jgi:hypothetical protein